MGKSAKIRHRRRRRQERRWTPMRLAEFSRILSAIMTHDPLDSEPPYAKWLTVKPYE